MEVPQSLRLALRNLKHRPSFRLQVIDVCAGLMTLLPSIQFLFELDINLSITLNTESTTVILHILDTSDDVKYIIVCGGIISTYKNHVEAISRLHEIFDL